MLLLAAVVLFTANVLLMPVAVLGGKLLELVWKIAPPPPINLAPVVSSPGFVLVLKIKDESTKNVSSRIVCRK